MFQGETVLEPFECFLNSPPGVIERSEGGGGVGVEVEERGDQDAHLVAEHLANQAHFTRRGGNFVVQRILFAGSGQPDDLLGQTGSSEGLNGAEIEAVRSHAEVPPALQQGGEEPMLPTQHAISINSGTRRETGCAPGEDKAKWVSP